MPRGFWWTLAVANAVLALAGAVYAGRLGLPASLAGPVVAAFLLQISFYMAAGCGGVRQWIEERLRPGQLAVGLTLAGIVPYLVYSVPTGVFAWAALGKLAVIAGVPAWVFVVAPTRRRDLTWQDLVVLLTVAVAELGRVYRGIYVSPLEGVRIEILGRFMILGVGAMAYLSLRKIEGSGYRLGAPSGEEWKAGLKQFALFLPVGVAVGLGIGFMGYRPVVVKEWWMYPLLIVGTGVGMYLVVALYEELFFRGVWQNLTSHSLGSPVAAQVVTSVLFGLVHLTFREFPNWRFAVLGAITGWFYGQAWRQGRSVVASGITHALVVTLWKLLFSG